MPLLETVLILCLASQIILTFFLLFYMGAQRRKALINKETHLSKIALDNTAWPDYALKPAKCFSNQFEIPLLFFVLVTLLLSYGGIDIIQAALAVLFATSRWVHMTIFITSNHVLKRATAYLTGVICILIMWIWFFIKILSTTP